VQGASAANASSQQNSLPQLEAQLQEHRAKGMCGDWICAMIMRARALGARPRRVPTDILHARAAPEAGDAPEAGECSCARWILADSGRSEPKKKPLESPLAYQKWERKWDWIACNLASGAPTLLSDRMPEQLLHCVDAVLYCLVAVVVALAYQASKQIKLLACLRMSVSHMYLAATSLRCHHCPRYTQAHQERPCRVNQEATSE